jgi:hypothetical protein
MSGPIDIKKLCQDAGEDSFSQAICSKLAKTCLKQQENEASTFILVDRQGKVQKFSDVDSCLKHSVLIPSGKKDSSGGTVAPSSGGTGAPSIDSSVCSTSGLNAPQEANCKNAADACPSGDGPFEIKTDAGPITGNGLEKCLKGAVKLAKAGYKIFGVNKAKEPTPPPKPTSEPEEDSSYTAPPVPKPIPKPKPAKKPPAKPKVSVPPAKAPEDANVCYEWTAPDKVALRMKGHNLNKIEVTTMCIQNALESYKITLGSKGDDFFSSPINICEDGKPPHFTAKHFYTVGVDNPGTLPVDPKQFLDWRCPKKPLIVNKGYKNYYSPKTRVAGEEDLKKLCKKANVEESFYFIEGLDKSGKPLSYWFELGYNQKSNHTETRINSCLSFGIQREFSNISGISQYHFHPTSGYKEFGSLYPSATDLESAVMLVTLNFDSRFGLNPKVLDKRVVTASGVWTLKSNFKAIRSDPDGAEKDDERYEAARKAFFKRIKKKELKNLSRAEQCALFAEKASSKFVEVTFEPF